MTKIFVIAEEVQIGYDDGTEPNFETMVAHNIGAFKDEVAANLKCAEMNAKAMGDEEDAENFDDIYFVLPIEIKD